MNKLAEISTAALKEQLDHVDEAKAAKRLMVALAYKDGVDVDTMSERFGIPQSTIYYWLDRLEEGPLDQALVDDPRPGRPSKLSAEQRAAVETWVASSPRERGLDAEEWAPELLREHIREEFDVTYSLGHVRRLLRELS